MEAIHIEVFRQKKLPDVGQIVRSKKYGTLWRVMEKREIWQHTAHDPKSREAGLVPAIYLTGKSKRECCQESEKCSDMHIRSMTPLLRQIGR